MRYIDNNLVSEVEPIVSILKDKFFPASLRFTEDATHNSLIEALLNYLLLPFAEEIYIVKDVIGLKSLEKEQLALLEQYFQKNLHLVGDFKHVLRSTAEKVYDPSLDTSDVWNEKTVYYFQSLLPTLNNYTEVKIEEFLTSGNVEEDFIYNLTIGWEGFNVPILTPLPEDITQGVYDEL